MKRLFLLLFFLTSVSLIQAQNPMQEVLKSYFRTHPFDMRFSSFITSLQQDPWFTVEEYDRRTDTTFFYLTGRYKNFNPFRYPAREIRLIVAESAYTHNDSLKTLDTIINIQLLGITDGGSSNQALVKKEFRRFDKNYSAKFWNSTYDKFEKGGEITAEVINYFIYPFAISPISAAWGKMPDSDQHTFTITIRCKLRQNIADLILTPAELKQE